MKRNGLIFFIAVMFVGVFFISMKNNLYAIDSAHNAMQEQQERQKKHVSLTKASRLYHLTFVSATDPKNLFHTAICPAGSLFESGSEATVPAFRNLPNVGRNKVNMWQCEIVVPVWAAKDEAAEKVRLDLRGLDTALTNINEAFATDNVHWVRYDNSNLPNTLYTAYPFIDNAYIPAAIGGSGIACGGINHNETFVKCQSQGKDIPAIPGDNNNVYYLYLHGDGEASCIIHREYGPLPSDSSRGESICEHTYTIKPGDAWIGACCGTGGKGVKARWNSKRGNLDDPALLECGGGCGPGTPRDYEEVPI